MTTHELQIGGSRLTLRDDGRLTFALAGKHVWQLPGPLFNLHYYDRQHPRLQTVPVPWDNSQAYGTAGTPSLSARSTLAVEKAAPDRLRLTVDFPNTNMKLTADLVMRADGAGFTLDLAADGLVESLPRLYRATGLEVFPEFGAARTGEQGYLTLPNWFGCQAFFDKDYPREIWQTVYSSNDQWEWMCNMPVFGITRAQGTLCGLISKGDYDLQLVCRRHWEAAHANSVHPFLVFRWQQEDEFIDAPRQVRYSFAPPDYPAGEGYVFCGKEYRSMLRAERGLMTWKQKKTKRPDAYDYAGRFFLKIFMAYKEPHPDGAGKYHITTTIEQARQIIQSCLDRGMKRLSVVLVGWGQDGHDGKCPTYLPIDDRVGGPEGMKALIAWAKANDVQLSVHTSHGGEYKCSPEFNVDDLVRHRTGEYWESIVWSGGQAHRACPKVTLPKFVRRDVPALAALGFHGHHHYDAVGGFMTCHSPLHPVTRRDEYIGLQRQEFQVALDVMGSVSTEMPFGQYFDVIDGLWHTFAHLGAWNAACPPGRYFHDRTIPLLPIVLHDSVKCCQGMNKTDDYLLELLDLGIYPQYEVAWQTSPSFGIPTYESAADALAKCYRFTHGPEGFVPRLLLPSIEARWDLAPGVARTLYSDGTTVVVNRSQEQYEDVPPGGYVISPKAPPPPAAGGSAKKT